MKSTNWHSKNRNPLPEKFTFYRVSGTILLLLGIIFACPILFANIRLEKSAQLNPPFDGFSPQVPAALSTSPADRLYLLDSQLAVVVELTLKGRALRQFGGPGSGLEQFSNPADLCATSGLDLFIADRGNDRIVRLDRKLNYLAQFKSLSGTHLDLIFENPLSVVLGLRGDLFIADGGNDRILKIDPLGRPVFSFGDYGEGKGSLLEPRRIEQDPRGGLWVLDSRGLTVHFDEYGGYLGEIQAEFSGRPCGLAVGNDAIWVCSDSLLWSFNRNTNQATAYLPEKIGISTGTVLVDLALLKEQIWLLDSRGVIYSFQVCDPR